MTTTTMTRLSAEDVLDYLDGTLSPAGHADMTCALMTDPEPASFVLDFLASIETGGALPIDTVAARQELLEA